MHDDERAWDESTWEGKNYLGYVLTEVRDELMEEADIIGNEDKKVGRNSSCQWILPKKIQNV